jgi:hypothetical protein
MGWMTEEWRFNSQQGQEIFRFSIMSRPALGPTQPVSLRVKRLGHNADHSDPSSAEVKNGGTIPPLPHTSSWHNFTFTFNRKILG